MAVILSGFKKYGADQKGEKTCKVHHRVLHIRCDVLDQLLRLTQMASLTGLFGQPHPFGGPDFLFGNSDHQKGNGHYSYGLTNLPAAYEKDIADITNLVINQLSTCPTTHSHQK
jgi:hypothetical protein